MSGPDTEIFREHEQPLAVRVADLVRRLTLDEKIALLHQHQPPIPRLGVGRFATGTEALHGLAWLGPATVFPQAVGLASTWKDRKSTRLNSSHANISYAVFCLKKKTRN